MTMRSKFGPPMTLANMRLNGVHAFTATCEACGHAADVGVDALFETVTVPKAGQRLRCSRCGGKRVLTRPEGRGVMAFQTLDQNARNRSASPSRRRSRTAALCPEPPGFSFAIVGRHAHARSSRLSRVQGGDS
jgi:hypothetical protein